MNLIKKGKIHQMSNEAQWGWTVVRRPISPGDTCKLPYRVYKRDCPATGAAADLAPFTHPTRKAAIEAGKRGEYAYKRASIP
jgi:hypothetical protein